MLAPPCSTECVEEGDVLVGSRSLARGGAAIGPDGVLLREVREVGEGDTEDGVDDLSSVRSGHICIYCSGY